jgi:hypothetical protein
MTMSQPILPLQAMAAESFTCNVFLSVAEISGESGSADQLRHAMFYRQTTLRIHLRRTRDLLLPRRLSGQVELNAN